MCQFSRPYDRVRPLRVAPGGTGYVNRLYALRGFPDELAQQVEEKFFKVVDDGAAVALGLFEAHGSSAKLSVNQRSAWSRFLLSLLARAPEDVEAFREVWAAQTADFSPEAEAEYAATRGPADPATLAEFAAGRPLADREREVFQAFISLMDNPSIGGRLNGHPFRVLDMPAEAPELLTSDRPIVRNHSGLGAPQGHMALPIGPRRLFVTAPDRGYLDTVERFDRRRLAMEMNRQVVQHAKDYAYGRTDEALPFVQKHFGTLQEPRLITMAMIDRMRKRAADEAERSRGTGWHALLAANVRSSERG